MRKDKRTKGRGRTNTERPKEILPLGVRILTCNNFLHTHHSLLITRWRFLLASSILMLLVFSVSPAMANTIPSARLVEECRIFNGKKVTYQGEVIGDVMIRGKNAWLNINDDLYGSRKSVEEGSKLKGYNSGQSIWCKASQVKSIKFKGDYQNSGDIVRVTGTFNRACTEHGGDMDIHAGQLEVVQRGHPILHPFNRQKALAALFLGILSGALYLINRLLSQRKLDAQKQLPS